MNPLGLDLSLTATGIAHSTGTVTIGARVKGAERLVTIRDKVLRWYSCDKATLVVVEGYSYASVNQAHQVGELGGVVRVALYERDIPVAVVSPGQRAKYATGRGNAKKAEVVSAISARSGLSFADDNQVDAWILRAMALDHYGAPLVQMPKAHRDVLDKIDWPDVDRVAA